MWKRSNNTTSNQALLAMGSMGILGGATPPAAYTLPSLPYYASQPPKQETSNKLTIVLVIWAVLATCGYIYHVALPAPGTYLHPTNTPFSFRTLSHFLLLQNFIETSICDTLSIACTVRWYPGFCQDHCHGSIDLSHRAQMERRHTPAAGHVPWLMLLRQRQVLHVHTILGH